MVDENPPLTRNWMATHPLPGLTMTEKRFNDEEVSLILSRALEADPGRADSGLTLAQLKEIAVEVGVDPSRIESAALTVQADRMAADPRRSGARTSTRYEVDVEGEIDRERYADLLRIIRAHMGRQGVVTEEFGGMTWKARDYFGGRYVTVTSEGGRTHVEALGNFRDGALVTGSAGGTIGLAVAAVVLKSLSGVAAIGAVGPAVLIAGAAIPAWAFFRRGFRKEDAALRQAVAEIAARVGEATLDQTPLPSASDPEALPPGHDTDPS
jgi:hypothetical protein